MVYKYPAGRLKVVIVGGGPTALSSAISLAEKGAGKVEVHMYEKRWIRCSTPNGSYVDYPADAKRRDQVVTLQDSVTSLMSQQTYQALFQGRPERVWPGSANIQIRKVEDRLLQRCQADEFRGLIHLYTEGLEREISPRLATSMCCSEPMARRLGLEGRIFRGTRKSEERVMRWAWRSIDPKGCPGASP